MVKNSPRFFKFLRTGLFLVGFLFFGFSGFGQSIGQPVLTENVICNNSTITLEFVLTSGAGRDRRYEDDSQFSVRFLAQNNSATITETINLENLPGNNSSINVSKKINIADLNLKEGDYSISIRSENPAANSIESELFTIIIPTIYTEVEAGSGSWIGHVYDEANQNRNFDQSFNNYIGSYAENQSFDQSFGGDTNDFQLGTGNCIPSVYTETFSIRYRMNSSLQGLYYMNIGSDDGSRLSIDGELIYSDWNDHSYRDQDILLNLTGNNNLVLDYYENTGGNRISTGIPQLLIENILSNNINQTLSAPSDAQEISGDEFATLPSGITKENTGFQWVYSSTQGGSTTPINGATDATLIPDTSIAPFNSPGTYYVYRIASLNGNNTGQNITASNISNPATIIVEDFCAFLEKSNHISFFTGNSGTLQATADEDEPLNLSAPEGTVFTYVNFASYGTPSSTNGSFSINESCHASTSQAVTESYLLGVASASIPATNTVFTDPCVGTLKRLYVEATYAEAFCKGIDPGTVSGSAVAGNNISYSWQLSTEGPASGFAPAPGNNNQQNYNPGILNAEIWLKRVVNSGSCTNESPVLYIPIQEENTWTGTENTNWNNTNNWSCNTLPTLETNVLIPENLVSNNYPVINTGANAFVKNLVLENNTSLQVDDNWLRIAGELTNNGILNTKTGSISFEGISAQTIPALAFENNRILNLQIDNATGVTSEAIIEVTGTLKVQNGNFDTGNELTLISDENQTALIDGSGNGEVVGLVSMQRYLDKAFGYKYFSSPFQNSEVGGFTPYMNFEDPGSGFPHFYRYDENRRVDSLDLDATGWEPYIDPNNLLNIAEGYALNFGTSTNAQTIELIGEVNNGEIPVRSLENNHREYTRGFHLVGNPYPSPIDWDATQGWTKTNIDDAIYFFTASDNNQYTGTYTAYVNNISTEDTLVDGRSSNIIPSMQGFFIKVRDSETQNKVIGSFGMNNNVRDTDFNQEFLRNQELDFKALFRLEAGFTGANRKDPMVIYFSSFATANFEKELDAHKLMNTDPTVPNFYNITDNKKQLAINAIPYPESRSYKKIPLGIKAEQSGQMQINLAAIENLSPNFKVYLIDHAKSIGQNLVKKPEYTFNIKAGAHNSRFELMFSEEAVPSPAIAFNEPFDVKVEEGNVVVVLNLEDNQKGILRASTITGQILQIKEGRGKDRVIFDGITSNGVYIINLQVGEARHAKKVVIKK